MNRKVPANRQVHLPGVKPPCKVPRRIAEARTDTTKGRRIDRPAPRKSLSGLKIAQTLKHGGAIGAVEIDRLPCHKIQSPIVLLSRCWVEKRPSVQRYRKACSRGKPVIETPVTQHGPYKCILLHAWHVIRKGG